MDRCSHRRAAAVFGQSERLEVRTLLTSTVTISASSLSITEFNDSSGVYQFFSVFRTGDISAAETITLGLSGTAQSGVDYTGPATSLYFPAGTSGAFVGYIIPNDDPWYEGNETVVATITSTGGSIIGSLNSATITIVDNDSVTPFVAVVATDATASEAGTNPGEFQFQRSGGSPAALTVNFTVSGDATSGSDYIPLGASVTVPAGQTTATLALTPLNDAWYEWFEYTIVTLAPGGYTGSSSAQVQIADDDAATTTITVTATDASASEPGTDTGTYTFSRSGGNSAALTANFTVSGTATSGADYAALGTSVSFAANQNTKTLTLTPLNDAWSEVSETAIVSLATGSGYAIGTPSQATVNISDNDPSTPTITVVATDPAASEPGTNTGTYTFTRNGGSPSAVTVNFGVSGTATSGTDYSALGTFVTFAANQTSKTLTLTPLDDIWYDPDETAIVAVSPGSGYTVGSPSAATVTIADNESALATVTVVATDSTAAEPGTDTGTYTFIRGGGSAAALTVNFTISGTAISGTDFFNLGTSVTFAANQTTKTLTLTPIDDVCFETDETAVLTLASGAYTIGSPGSATITITDEDPPAPGSTSITLQTANTNGVVEMIAGQTSQNVILTWDIAAGADAYDIQLWRFEGTGPYGGWVLHGGYEQTSELQKLYSGLTVGLYAFYVRGTNCGGVQKGAWAGKAFAIVAYGDLTPSNSGQHNNHEDACECDSQPPGETAAGANVNAGSGDLLLPLRNLASTVASSLSSYLFPSYVSGGDSQMTVDVTIPLPAGATDIAVDVEVKDQNGVVVGLDTIRPGTNSSQINLDGTMSLRIDPANLKDSGGNPVAPLVSGNYKITMNIRADLPGWAPAAPISMNFQSATVDVHYVKPSDRSFANSFAAPGLNRLRIDNSGLSLFRSNGTSVRFAKNVGNTHATPDGSFTSVATITMNVADPLGGAARVAVYKLTTASGMISLFDTAGLLLERCEANGDVIRFAYHDKKGDGTADDLVRVQSVTTNQNIDYNYTAGKVLTVTDWTGQDWTYTYDAGGMITSMTGPVPTSGKPAPKIVLTYDAGTSQIASWTVTDTASSFTETTEVDWDTHGNVSQIRALDTQGTSGGMRTWSFISAESRQLDQMRIVDDQGAIGPQDQFDQVTFPDGSVSKTRVDNFGNTLREERTVNGYFADTTVTTAYTRNTDGQPISIGPMVQKIGSTSTSVPGMNHAYDSSNRMTLATYADGTTEVWTYAMGASAKQPATYKNRVGNYFVYPAYSDRFPTQVDYYSSQGGTLVSTTWYTYDHGRVRTVATSDPNGQGGTGVGVELYYDGHFNLIHARTTTATAAGVIAPASINDIWVSFGYDGSDNPAWATTQYKPANLSGPGSTPLATDASLAAVRTDFTTDAYGRILTSLSPIPASGQSRLLTSATYDAIGRLLTSTESGSADPVTRTTTTARNSFGEIRSVAMPDPDDAGPLLVPSVTYTYDLNGNLFETRQLNGATAVSRMQSTYDSLGRLRKQSMVLPGTSSGVPANEATYYQYDAAARIIKVESPVGVAGLNENKYLATNITYDDVLRKITTSYSTTGVGVIAPNVADTVQEFDAIGRKTRVAQGGLTVTNAYIDYSTWDGVRGTLVRTTDERGQVWWQKYGPTGLLTRTQTPDPDGTGPLVLLDTQNVYDSRGNINAVTESSGSLSRTTSYTFDFRDLLTSITSPVPGGGTSLPALVTTYGYDKLQRPITESGPTGVTMVTTYRDDGLLGAVTRDDYNVATTDRFTTYDYDNLNRVKSMTTPDGLSTLVYDSLGNVNKRTTPDPDGAGPLGPMSMTYIYATTTAGQFLSETLDTNNSQTKFTTDSAGRVVAQFRANHTNNISQQLTDGTASTTATETWSYDAIGHQLTSTDALGSSLSYSYDTLSRLTSMSDGTRTQTYVYATNGDLTNQTDPLGRTTQYVSYDSLGRLTQSQRMLGAAVNDISNIAYDGFGRVASTTALAGVAGKEMVTSYQYDNLDRTTRVTDGLGGQTSYFYDTRGFLNKTDDPLGHATHFYSDDHGRLQATWTEGFTQTTGTRYTFDTMDRVKTVTDPVNSVTSYEYDKLGRVIKRTDPVQSAGTPVTEYTYDADGNLKSLKDPQNSITSYEYDARNRLRRDTITLNSSAVTREYWYDNADNLFWSKDRNGRWTRYSFDFAFGAGSGSNYKLTEEAWWVSGSTYSNRITNTYNAGNGLLLTEITDQRNLTTSTDFTSRVNFTYDALARITSTTDWLQPQTKSDAFELKYFYADGVDRRTSTEARFAKFNTSTGAQTNNYWDFHNTYVWDQLNRVDWMKQESANNPTATTWAANASSIRAVDLNYFADSSLQMISRTQGTAGTTPIVSTYTQTTDNARNEGRLASIVQSGLYIGSTATNLTYGYSYDDQGRVSSFTTPAGTRNYAYDSFNQVTGASGGTQPAEAYIYDRNGNRTGAGVTTSAYNRVTNDGTYTYLYDAEGNRIRRTLISNGEYETYDFDYRQRLIRVTKKSSANAVIQTVDYEYDGLDRRIRRTVSNAAGTVIQKQRFLYDTNVLQSPSLLPRAGGEVARRADEGAFQEQVIMLDELVSAQPYQQVDHRYMNGPAIDQVFADEGSGTGNQVLWYLSDQQNTVRDVAKYVSTGVNGKATVYNHLEYDAFGNITSADNPTTAATNDGHQPGLQGTGTVNQYSPQRTYTGREPDSATGLIYYRARWYDPKLGKFISEDPIGFAAGDANLSRYVGNSTPNAVDPSGLWSWKAHRTFLEEFFRRHPGHEDVFSPSKMARGGVRMDISCNFDDSQNPQHYMVPGTKHSDPKDDDWAKRVAHYDAEMFVMQEVGLARKFYEDGDYQRAQMHLARALHATMDSTSPAHTGSDGWPTWWINETPNRHSPNEHTGIETANDITTEIMDETLARMERAWRAFLDARYNFQFPVPPDKAYKCDSEGDRKNPWHPPNRTPDWPPGGFPWHEPKL